MFLATCLVTLKTKSLNLTKVVAMCNLVTFKRCVFYVESIKCTQNNFKIIEDVENVDHLHQYSTMKMSHHIFQNHRIIVPKFYVPR
jgi:hypothetical protein